MVDVYSRHMRTNTEILTLNIFILQIIKAKLSQREMFY